MPRAPIDKPLALCIVTDRLDDRLIGTIGNCAPYFDEVLVGYNGPPDPQAIEKAEANGARVFVNPWEGFGASKNRLASEAKSDWIFSMDSDEAPDDRLMRSVSGFRVQDAPIDHLFGCRRLSNYEGKWVRFGSWGNDFVTRVYNKAFAQWDLASVHETLVPKEGRAPAAQKLPGLLMHHTAENASDFRKKNDRYARLAAQKYYKDQKGQWQWKRFVSPLFGFIKEYIFQLGFLDGKAGWEIARINAGYTYKKYRFLGELYQRASNELST